LPPCRARGRYQGLQADIAGFAVDSSHDRGLRDRADGATTAALNQKKISEIIPSKDFNLEYA
jgi:hypothetical protein